MFGRAKLQRLEDYFLTLEQRDGRGIYFYRINGYNEEVDAFIRRYYEEARSGGVVVEGRIPNPDGKNLAYYKEIMGDDFQLSMGFLTASLKKWLPRMDRGQRDALAAGLYDVLDGLRKNGKNENMLKNAYIKFMCWLYYRFERVVRQLGGSRAPKVLYEGEIGAYELQLLHALAGAGCDVALLQYNGDGNYRKLDAASVLSDNLELPGMGRFPDGYCLERIREEAKKKQDAQRLYGKLPEISNCTNAWITGKGLEDFRVAPSERGSDPKLFYNCYCRIQGVEDKLTYRKELYEFQAALKNSGRRLLIVDGEIPPPAPEEIGAVRRGNYTRTEDMLLGLSGNIQYPADMQLHRLMVKGFLDVMMEEAAKADAALNRLTNQAVVLLCWLKRYQEKLFAGWKMPQVSCFIHMGGCRHGKEAMFLRLLARLPVDVLTLKPNRQDRCCLEDALLYEKNYEESLTVQKFPREDTGLHIGTVAYQAQQELDTLLYEDSGMYRNQQYGKAVAVTLQTTYEEIAILWKQELKYRPNFSTVGDVVSMPVLFAKASGVKDGDLSRYWAGIRALQTGDAYFIKKAPFVDSMEENPVRPYASGFLKNGKLLREKIKQHTAYPYGMLREQVQEHILDQLQTLLDRRLIKGIYENGTEYTAIATALNMKKELVRLIQKFDFTRQNPKAVYINAGEKVISLEDSILMALLHLMGFDVVFFVPTGYRSVEGHFQGGLLEEHQLGEYMYDLRVPDFAAAGSGAGKRGWMERIFRKA